MDNDLGRSAAIKIGIYQPRSVIRVKILHGVSGRVLTSEESEAGVDVGRGFRGEVYRTL